MPVTIYDVSIDATREVTQEDIDMLTATAQAYGRLRAAVAEIEAVRMSLVQEVLRRGKPVIEVPDSEQGDQSDGR